MSDYSEQLRDPRWQKKRLEIMQRDEFSCVLCGAKDKTLNVRHGYYQYGLAPWEYDPTTLHTLCEDCHSEAKQTTDQLRRAIVRLMACTMDRAELLRISGYVIGRLGLSNLYKVERDFPNTQIHSGYMDAFMGALNEAEGSRESKVAG